MEPHCCGSTGEILMRAMKLREIVIESGRFIKKHWRCLTFFLLAFYLPFATFTCISLRLLNVPRLFNLHHPLFLITVTLILVLYVALYYLQLAATILVWGAPFHSPLEDSDRTPESNQQLLTASLHSARRMLLTDMLTLAIFSLASFLFTIILTITFIIWINLVMSNSITIWIPVLSYTMEFETIAFMIWVIHFTLEVSLTRPVATMEHLWGMAAIRRSGALVRGRTMTAITALISVSVYVYASTDERFEAFCRAFLHDGPTTLAVPLGFVLSYLGSVIFVSLLATGVGTLLYFCCCSGNDRVGLDLELAAYKPVPASGVSVEI